MLEHLPRMFPSAATFSSTDVIKILFALMIRLTGRKKKSILIVGSWLSHLPYIEN